MHIFTTQSLVFFLLSLISHNALTSTESPIKKSSIVDKVHSIISKQEEDKPGIAVLLRKDNKVILKVSKGLANKNTHLTIGPSTGFRIGSISKSFNALAIMKLVEQERLSLEDEVTEFVEGLPLGWKGITIQHLLSHRVYISNDFFSDSNLEIANQSTNEDLIKFVSSNNITVKALAFDKAMYCNSCFVLLAEVIKEASESSFSDYLNQNIFAPANMKNTYIVEKGVSIKPNDALNYALTESFLGINQFTTGAMAQVSSIEDLNNFIIALKAEKIVSQETLNLITKVHSDAGDDGTFGLGWMIGWGDKPFFSHGGSLDGYQSELFFYPKYDIEVAILTNGGDSTYELQSQIMRAILTHYH